jgi:circadian clock protein KaiC
MESSLVATGISGLDTILEGGFSKGRVHLLEGDPGTGKTTMSLQFLLEGKKSGEKVMLISFIEIEEEIHDIARSHGWSMEGVYVPNLFQDVIDSASAVQTLFPPSDIEFGEVAESVIEAIVKYRPDRVVIDSISQLSMLTNSWYQARGPLLKIKEIVHKIGCTALFTSGAMGEHERELETIVHGAISLETVITPYGPICRELIIKKMRGRKFTTGYHNYQIRTGGVEIFTWPDAPHDSIDTKWDIISSGIQELDNLLGGGLEKGTASLFTGNTGTGKSTLASLYVQAAAKRGENSVIFCFDERKDTFLRRSTSLGLEISSLISQGLIDLRQVNVGQLSPGEFTQIVRDTVEEKKATVVVIDSLSGYMSAMPGEKMVITQLHELLSYLSALGILTIMIVTRYGSTDNSNFQLDASYIADSIVLLRHFEAFGSIHRCIAVIKKRHGYHEKTIREFKIAAGGCEVGQPLEGFSGIFTNNPTYTGKPERLFKNLPEKQN